jgi:hypothetical protein
MKTLNSAMSKAIGAQAMVKKATTSGASIPMDLYQLRFWQMKQPMNIQTRISSVISSGVILFKLINVFYFFITITIQ